MADGEGSPWADSHRTTAAPPRAHTPTPVPACPHRSARPRQPNRDLGFRPSPLVFPSGFEGLTGRLAHLPGWKTGFSGEGGVVYFAGAISELGSGFPVEKLQRFWTPLPLVDLWRGGDNHSPVFKRMLWLLGELLGYE